MSTQRQERRGTATQNDGLTGAEGETTYITDGNTLAVHDGLTSGGIYLLNQNNQANQTFNSGVVTGTNTLTLTISRAPPSYQNLQKYSFRVANTNTGAVTINVNGLGVKNIKKIDISAGALTDLSSGDLIQNITYEITYNGTDFVISNIGGNTSKTEIYNGNITGSNQYFDVDWTNGLYESVDVLIDDLSHSGSSAVNSTGALQLKSNGTVLTANYFNQVVYGSVTQNYSGSNLFQVTALNDLIHNNASGTSSLIKLRNLKSGRPFAEILTLGSSGSSADKMFKLEGCLDNDISDMSGFRIGSSASTRNISTNTRLKVMGYK